MIRPGRVLVVFAVLLLAGAAASRGATFDVVFAVRPASLPPGARVFLAGNHPALGSWNAAGARLEPRPDGSWTGRFAFERGTHLEYKVTLGSWDAEALAPDGSVPGNHMLDVSKAVTVDLPVARWKDRTFKPRGQITGRVDVFRNRRHPGLLPRDLQVWLPPSYATEPSRRYPVLYMHDAQQVFDPATSTHGIDWQVDETATRLIREGRMREIIVVATTCTKDRADEYSDTPRGRAYMDFVVNRLKPLVDRLYRTRPGRVDTAVMGSSMGGRISFLLAWNHPEVFSMAGCLSSAFFGDLARSVERYQGPAKRLRFYLDNGGLGPERILQPGNDRMLQALQKKGWVLGKDLVWFRDAKAEHNEEAWATRAWMPLSYFFGTGPQEWIERLAPPPPPVHPIVPEE